MSEYLIGKDFAALESRVSALEELLPGASLPRTQVDSDSKSSSNILPGQLIRDPGFEDTVYAHPWGFRCQNRLVYRDPGQAHSGIQYLAVGNAGGTIPNPSIHQDVYVGFDGTYNVEFQIWAKSRSPVERRLEMVLWQWTNTVPTPTQRASELFNLTTGWTVYHVSAQGGGRYWRCEAYWHDFEPVDIMFDDVYCVAVKL